MRRLLRLCLIWLHCLPYLSSWMVFNLFFLVNTPTFFHGFGCESRDSRNPVWLCVLVSTEVRLHYCLPDLCVFRISGVAIGSGWQGVVAYVNLTTYYIIGLPIGCVLGFKTSLGAAVSQISLSLSLSMRAHRVKVKIYMKSKIFVSWGFFISLSFCESMIQKNARKSKPQKRMTWVFLLSRGSGGEWL